MFESNQSIMLMGAAGTIDIAAHLANADSNIESKSNNTITDNSVKFNNNNHFYFCSCF